VNDGEIGKMVMEDKMNLSIKTLARGKLLSPRRKSRQRKKPKEEVRRRLRWEVGLSNAV
jgi:hypothetical protein